MKSEVIMIGSRTAFDSAIRLCGAKLVVVPTVDELQAAINSKTAMIYNSTQRDDDSIKKILAISKPAGVPMLVDAAAGIPPFDNFSRFAKLGVDLYCFSGGKGMCGPQDSGVLLGRKDLIESARYNCAPWEGSICRPMKVGKEEIMGLIAAIDYWSKADPNAQFHEWQQRAERMQGAIKGIPGVTAEIIIPPNSNSFPTLAITWDEKKFGLTVMECAAQLREGEPSIETLTPVNPSTVASRLLDLNHPPRRGNGPLRLQVASLTLQPGEDVIVGRRLHEVLTGALKKAGA
jgi:seryl-tRNA(Sec) selenium transferase